MRSGDVMLGNERSQEDTGGQVRSGEVRYPNNGGSPQFRGSPKYKGSPQYKGYHLPLILGESP